MPNSHAARRVEFALAELARVEGAGDFGKAQRPRRRGKEVEENFETLLREIADRFVESCPRHQEEAAHRVAELRLEHKPRHLSADLAGALAEIAIEAGAVAAVDCSGCRPRYRGARLLSGAAFPAACGRRAAGHHP